MPSTSNMVDPCSSEVTMTIVFQVDWVLNSATIFKYYNVNLTVNSYHRLVTVFVRCSSEATKARAKVLADEIGSWHLDVCIDGVISSLLSLFQTLTGKRPRYKVKGVQISSYDQLRIILAFHSMSGNCFVDKEYMQHT